ncbi:MAG: tRNA lysidine(34) synthetase TilS [Chloroflexi bacterium]|nr:MAG: tRNA lysidine(34) synthetase TilS [Chloroflexota bacterium]TME48504.1 MAG: tRNA lysidine(34) synthetase TilS [Chloroflexota bacterium]
MKLPQRVAIAIGLHRILTAGERVVVAVSGGPDSLALLSVLRELLPALPLHLTVAHFDHGWRADSEADRDFVRDIARQWGFDFLAGRAARDTPHTEGAARTARYDFLRNSAAQTHSSAIALGHTQDDQVETLLLHLLRGSGSRGLAAMRRRDRDLARPLLDVPRKDVEAYLTRLHLTPRRDPTNDDPRFTRNRLRQELLPAIDAFDPSARELLARTADILAEEDRYLDEQVARLPPGSATDRQAFRTLPPALQRRVIRQLIPQAGFAGIEAARRDDAPLPPSVDRDGSRDGTQSSASTQRLTASACRCDRASFKARDQVGHLDGDLVQPPFTVGTRKPGDRMRPLGLPAPKRLQDILVDAHVPRHLRDSLPIVSDREEIVWIPGVTVSERKRVRPQTTHQLHLEIVRG